MQNIKSYNLKIKEYKIIANTIGLNPKEKRVYTKQRHNLSLRKRVIFKQKIKDDQRIFKSFGALLKNYKYFRNINGYPCRGQRTHTNAKTKKKNKFKSLL